MPTERLDRWGLMQACHQLLDEEIDVLFFQSDWGVSTGFRGKLAQVEGIPLDGDAIALDFEGPNQLTIGPGELTVHRGALFHEGSGASWIEIELGFGGVIWIEQVACSSSEGIGRASRALSRPAHRNG